MKNRMKNKGDKPAQNFNVLPLTSERWLILFFIFGIVLSFATTAQGSTASWYGTTGDTCDPWKHTTTASGQPFDENALTAASWKYPLGSRVKVTNLRTGHAVVVLINDRGPGKKLYRKGRIIDLSRGAFSKIADLKEGIIPVKVVLIKSVKKKRGGKWTRTRLQSLSLARKH